MKSLYISIPLDAELQTFLFGSWIASSLKICKANGVKITRTKFACLMEIKYTILIIPLNTL